MTSRRRRVLPSLVTGFLAFATTPLIIRSLLSPEESIPAVLGVMLGITLATAVAGATYFLLGMRQSRPSGR